MTGLKSRSSLCCDVRWSLEEGRDQHFSLRGAHHTTAYQIYFGVLFHNALVFLRVIPVPAVAFSIVVQVELDLTVFIRRYARTRELCSNFSGPLLNQT